jgi:hypothetical protein
MQNVPFVLIQCKIHSEQNVGMTSVHIACIRGVIHNMKTICCPVRAYFADNNFDLSVV